MARLLCPVRSMATRSGTFARIRLRAAVRYVLKEDGDIQTELRHNNGSTPVQSSLNQVRRPQFSWTRIKGESDVKGGGGHGWVEEGAGSGVGADGAAVGAGALAPGQRWEREPESRQWFCSRLRMPLVRPT